MHDVIDMVCYAQSILSYKVLDKLSFNAKLE